MAPLRLDRRADRTTEGLSEMDRTMLSFNFPNIVTVTLMAAIGYAGLAIISQIIMRRQGGA